MGERYYTHYDGPFTGFDVDDDDHSLGFSRVSVVKSPKLAWESSSCPTFALALCVLSFSLSLSRPAALPRCHLSLIFLPHFLALAFWHSVRLLFLLLVRAVSISGLVLFWHNCFCFYASSALRTRPLINWLASANRSICFSCSLTLDLDSAILPHPPRFWFLWLYALRMCNELLIRFVDCILFFLGARNPWESGQPVLGNVSDWRLESTESFLCNKSEISEETVYKKCSRV